MKMICSIKKFRTWNISFLCLFMIIFLFSCGKTTEDHAINRWNPGISYGWKFAKGSPADAVAPGIGDFGWETVDLPHDWAISGPFGALDEPGNTGKLPWKGEAWYRKHFRLDTADAGKRVQFLFDGVMANPEVYLNGQEIGSWRYGYNSFWIDATGAANFGGENVLAVHADTREHSSRWYPGAGIYRKVSMRLTDPLHIPVWGVYITTPEVSENSAEVTIAVDVRNDGMESEKIKVVCSITDPEGNRIGSKRTVLAAGRDTTATAVLRMNVGNPLLWDVDAPRLYTLATELVRGNTVIHREEQRFGIRSFEWTADDGFHLNGRRVQLKGVNLHHDQGPLGAAFFPRAMQRQLEIMKEMGVNAIRTSHNACAPEVLDLCDEMGIIVYNELFDKYGPTAGINCSTAEFVDHYAEAEVKNFVLRDRNHPSVFLWSIGNEIGELLGDTDGKAAEHIRKMVSYFRQWDATRPTTMGCHIPWVSEGGKHILDALETTGWNYDRRYVTTRQAYPEMPLIYSESASAFGTRGAYKPAFPENKIDYGNDGDITAYMLTAAPWSDIPEIEFEYMRIDTFIAGEFVWTGFDYLGEPTPFTRDRWGVQTPGGGVARSSYFGIVDLAGLPKDSYYNYRSHWKEDDHTIHLTPHWNWGGHEGKPVPVMLYTDGDEAELFLNGKSLGRKSKISTGEVMASQLMAKDFTYHIGNFDWDKGIIHDTVPYYQVVDAYRIIWKDVPYEAGEIKAVVYRNGEKIGEDAVQTAGPAAGWKLTPDRSTLKADGMDLCYVTIERVDEAGNLCPWAMDRFKIVVAGPARMMGIANGDAMGHDPFTDESHTLFYGKAVAVLRSTPGLSGPATIRIGTEEGLVAEATVNFE